MGDDAAEELWQSFFAQEMEELLARQEATRMSLDNLHQHPDHHKFGITTNEWETFRAFSVDTTLRLQHLEIEALRRSFGRGNAN